MRVIMNALHRFGLLSTLVVCVAAGCDDDGDSIEVPGAAGETNVAGSANEGGTGGTDAGAGGDAGTATAAGNGGESATSAAGRGGEAGGGGEVGGSGGEAGGGGDAGADPLGSSTVIDVNDVKTHPESYEWFDFRPNVKKLILAGAAETEHIAILWYTVTNGGVGLHYHAKTESVYVIDGSQTDGKGTYTDGTVYYNPPGSGHQVTDSGGFFLLAYSAPPDFVNTSLIEEYTPVRIDTTDPDLTTTLTFTEAGAGVQIYDVPVEESGGLSSTLIETTTATPYAYDGNYILVLEGSCVVEGTTLAAGRLVVAEGVTPRTYAISAPVGSTCLALTVSF